MTREGLGIAGIVARGCDASTARRPPHTNLLKYRTMDTKEAATDATTTKTEIETEHTCAKCGQRAALRCSRCKAVHYCNRTCQSAHWKGSHKHECRKPGDEAKAIGDTKMCAICWEDFDKTSDRAILPLACRHRFHSACINDLQRKGVESKHLCPFCRKDLPVSVDTLVADAWTLRTRAEGGRGKLSGARQRALMQESEAKLREALGRDPDNIEVLSYLGQRLEQRAKWAEAEKLLQRALELTEAKYGAKHNNTLTALDHLAGFLGKQGRPAEAEQLLRRAVAGYKQVEVGASHKFTLNATSRLAMALAHQEEKQDEAAQLFRQVLMDQEKELGKDHELTMVTVTNLAGLLQSQDKPAEALPLMRRSAVAFAAQLGDEHPLALRSVGNLATALRKLDQMDEAEALFRRVLTGNEARHGTDHPMTVAALWNLAAFLHQDRNQYAEALPLYRRAATGCAANPGDPHCQQIVHIGRPQKTIAECEELLAKKKKETAQAQDTEID